MCLDLILGASHVLAAADDSFFGFSAVDNAPLSPLHPTLSRPIIINFFSITNTVKQAM